MTDHGLLQTVLRAGVRLLHLDGEDEAVVIPPELVMTALLALRQDALQDGVEGDEPALGDHAGGWRWGSSSSYGEPRPTGKEAGQELAQASDITMTHDSLRATGENPKGRVEKLSPKESPESGNIVPQVHCPKGAV